MKGIDEMSIDELTSFVDDHLLMALVAADRLLPLTLGPGGGRQESEDYLRNRLVALSDTFTTPEAAEHEDSRRRMDRLGRALREGAESKAFNDPSVDCCGRDAADCDCPPAS